MICKMLLLATLVIFVCIYNKQTIAIGEFDSKEEMPTVVIALLVRNKAHTLPYFLTNLEKQDYPKTRLALWIRSDHNEDSSVEILKVWLRHTSHLYHNIDFHFDTEPIRHQNETSPTDWPLARFHHLIKLKEEALTHARKIWADFILFLDIDVLLTNPQTLKTLISLRRPIVAPMLLSEGLYSNFWCGMTADYYYQRTDEYKEIYNYKKYGHFQVPMVHSAVLINLNYVASRWLTFNRDNLIEQQKRMVENGEFNHNCAIYNGPLDDIIIFAISAKCSNIPMYVSNTIVYGYIIQPLENTEPLERDQQQLLNIKLNIINDDIGDILVNSYFDQYITQPSKHKLTLDHIYMINLERRSERRVKMEKSLKELGLDAEYFAAIDGKSLNLNIIKQMGIEFLKGYEDPYQRRQMTMGEVGCFLSHYRIWEKIVEQNQSEVLVLEDDIRFEPYFTEQAESILEQARNTGSFDLIYFGRKRLKDEIEPWVEGTENLVHVGYSYWTLGYVITVDGARKLLDAKPLQKLLPVDEFLPIMFDRHPNNSWSSAFWPRNLIAYSAAPLVLFPTHYTGDVGYISDTEDSDITVKAMDTSEIHQMSERKTFPDISVADNLSKEESFVANEIQNTGIRKHDANEL